MTPPLSSADEMASKSDSEEIFHLGLRPAGPCEVEETVIMLFSGAAISLGAGGRWPAPPSPSSVPRPILTPPFPTAHLHAYLSFCMAARVFFCLSDRLSLSFYMLTLCVCVRVCG